jgi:hypothetical protein
MLTKKQVLKSIEEMPEEFPLDEVIERLMLLHKVQRGSQEIKEGKGLTTEEAKQKLQKWLR